MVEPADVGSVVAQVITNEAVFVGTVLLPVVPGTTAHFRFLELLNNPRLGAPPGGQRDSLALTGATILPRSGPAIPVAGELLVRPEAIVCAFEYEKHRRPADPRFFTTAVHRKPESVLIVTANGLRIEGWFGGGVTTLAAVHPKPFLPIVDASYAVIDNLETQLHTPFLAINHAAIVAFSKGDGAKFQDDPSAGPPVV